MTTLGQQSTVATARGLHCTDVDATKGTWIVVGGARLDVRTDPISVPGTAPCTSDTAVVHSSQLHVQLRYDVSITAAPYPGLCVHASIYTAVPYFHVHVFMPM